MCTQSQLNIVTSSIAIEAKKVFGNLLDSVILYGSYARDDYDEESDIDIMVKINCSSEDLKKYKYVLTDFVSNLSLENDVTISVIVFDIETFTKYRNAMPFLMNVEREGVKVA